MSNDSIANHKAITHLSVMTTAVSSFPTHYTQQASYCCCSITGQYSAKHTKIFLSQNEKDTSDVAENKWQK